MRIVTLENSGELYTSQVYLVLGDASRIDDVNTLVDVGQDPAVLASIERAPTGIGKWPVEQVVLTHAHSDHYALLPLVRATLHPKVFAFSPNIEGVDCLLRDGDTIKMGDGYFEVIHTPGHSSDSICLYNQAEGVLFAGDSPLLITSPTGTYEAGFLAALEKMCARDVRRIYFGHGAPLVERCNERLRESRMMAAGSQPAPEGNSGSRIGRR
jgi:glyoxylase-like metal-dependent hydrolase (beta-lactamase superfamily II)